MSEKVHGDIYVLRKSMESVAPKWVLEYCFPEMWYY